MQRTRVLFINRSYWPDSQATGQLLTELCEDLGSTFDVEVLAGRPERIAAQTKWGGRRRERRNGVEIRRVFNTQFAKQSIWGRVLNWLTYWIAVSITALFVKRPSVVVVETDPPLLCLLGVFLKQWYGCQLVVYLQDLYPDVAVAVGKIREGWLTRVLRAAVLRCYRRADRVVVISQDMQKFLVSQGIPADRLECIANWADSRCVYPVKVGNPFRRRHGLENQFVVMYSGNLGLTQPLLNLLHAARLLREFEDISFVLVGDGVTRPELEAFVRHHELPNVLFLDSRPKDELAASLSAADLHFVPLAARVAKCLMPSKFYGVLASGTPAVVAAPVDTELSQVTQRYDVGLLVAPDDVESLVETIEWAAAQPGELADLGRRARQLLVEKYDRPIATRRFAQLLQSVLGHDTHHEEVDAADDARVTTGRIEHHDHAELVRGNS